MTICTISINDGWVINMNDFSKITLIFDIDGTLCPIKESQQAYEDIVPFQNMVDKLKEYKERGAKIVLFTSRNMNSYSGNIGLINAHTAKVILHWLEKNQIPYDEIIYGKPWPGINGFYIDDRSVRPDEFLRYSIEELNELCTHSRKAVRLENNK